jgi:ATP-dependent Lon protease
MKRYDTKKSILIDNDSESNYESDSESSSKDDFSKNKFLEDNYNSDDNLLISNKKQRTETFKEVRNNNLGYDNDRYIHKNCEKNKKYKNIQNEINNRNITMNQIYELEMDIDDYVWFYQYIKLRDNTDESEDKINLINMIYNKYNKLKDIDYIKIENLKKDSISDKCIVKKIIDSEHNDYIKTILYKKYKLFCEDHDSNSEEYSKCIEWIDTALSLPTQILMHSSTKQSEIANKLLKLHNFLSTKIYGLDQVKEQIMQAMYRKIQNPYETSGKIITLVGSPGVGKTWVASIIAEAMNMPFDQISFGSIQDSKILTGHSTTYIGAVPGLFTKILIKSKRKDLLILLDEIDKINNTTDNNITSVLLHVLDKSQNDRFKDIYIPEIPLDLSQIIFLGAANNIDLIDPILRDRMTIINLPGYSIRDKINIAEIYLIPKLKKELHLNDNEIIIENKELEYLILNKTKEQHGMRDVERKLQDLFEKLGLLKYNLKLNKNIPYTFNIKNIKFPLKLTIEIIDRVLGKNVNN